MGAKIGHFVSEETRRKIGEKARGRKLPEYAREFRRQYMTGKRNEQGLRWKGDEAGYRALHYRLGKAPNCMNCGSSGGKIKGCHWANISGHLTDPTDYIPLCPTCHKKFDFGIIGIIPYALKARVNL